MNTNKSLTTILKELEAIDAHFKIAEILTDKFGNEDHIEDLKWIKYDEINGDPDEKEDLANKIKALISKLAPLYRMEQSGISIDYRRYHPDLELLLRSDCDDDERLPPDGWTLETKIAEIRDPVASNLYFVCDHDRPFELEKDEAYEHFDRGMVEDPNPPEELVEKAISAALEALEQKPRNPDFWYPTYLLSQ